MGIGIDTGEAVVGNIGSETRTNYSAIGTPINTAHRIESYTVGGQILISPNTFEKVRDLVEVKDTLQVQFKGLDQPFSVYDIIGLSGKYACSLPEKAQENSVTLVPPLAVECFPVKDKTISDKPVPGHILRLTGAAAEVELEGRVGMHSTLKIRFSAPEATGLSEGYAKVLNLDPTEESSSSHNVRLSFTSLPEDTKAYLDRIRSGLA
jgi:adenylate cyclase